MSQQNVTSKHNRRYHNNTSFKNEISPKYIYQHVVLRITSTDDNKIYHRLLKSIRYGIYQNLKFPFGNILLTTKLVFLFR